MRDRADFVEDIVLIDLVADHWGYRVEELEYWPVGAGAHHWTAQTDGG